MLTAQEFRRQLIHAATALIPLLYYFFPDIGPLTGQQWVLILFIVFGGLFVFADYFRRHSEFVKKAFVFFVSPFIRDIEEEKMTAASHIGITFFLILAIFPIEIWVLMRGPGWQLSPVERSAQQPAWAPRGRAI